MKHLKMVERQKSTAERQKRLSRSASGTFYTHRSVATFMNSRILKVLGARNAPELAIIEPFCGDGRLIRWMLEDATAAGYFPRWRVSLWDRNEASVADALQHVRAAASRLSQSVIVDAWSGDTFVRVSEQPHSFDLCLTNPPWDALKPDRRELEFLGAREAARYVQSLRQVDAWLAEKYPHSQPQRKFAGWGTNLSRVGVESSIKLLNPKGVLGIVLPASVFADQNSISLRRHFFQSMSLHSAAYFPAEQKLFESADQIAIALVAERGLGNAEAAEVLRFGGPQTESTYLTPQFLERCDYCIPFQSSSSSLSVLQKIASFPTWAELEAAGALWSGREIDETNCARYLQKYGSHPFVKGKMVGRFAIVQHPDMSVDPKAVKIPKSAGVERLAWRDVSRPSQSRRMQASIIPAGWVAGNSLNVAYVNRPRRDLSALLAIANSFVFEAQIRTRLATSHISLGSVRMARIAGFDNKAVAARLAKAAGKCATDPMAQLRCEIEVARAYGLDVCDLEALVSDFNGIGDEFVSLIRQEWKAT